jgi:protein TonB
VIDVDGRAKGCRIARSSGSRAMDQAACRALEQRFRFAPARDESGRPISIPGEDNPYFEVEAYDPPDPRERRRGW